MGLVPHNWFGMGNTSFYGEYGRAADYIRSGPANSAVAGFVNPVTNGFEAASSEAEFWGLGVVQQIDAAAMAGGGMRPRSAALATLPPSQASGMVRASWTS